MKSPLIAAIKLSFLFLILACFASSAFAERMDSYQIGAHGQAHLKYPPWFKKSFLDLRDDLNEAREQGKRGIIVFFSQKNCNHCQAFISTTLSDAAIRKRVQKSYDIVGLDIFSDLELTDIDGSVSPIRDFAEKQKARLTPTLLFYGVENKRLLRILGFYPPEKFDRVLDYIEDNHYQRVGLRQYLHSASLNSKQKQTDLNYDYSLFAKPPHRLNRSDTASKRPLMVLFEAPNCNPCARFHKRVLANKEVQGWMAKFDNVQLNSEDNQQKLTLPDGRQLTPKQWADELKLVYDVSVVFFDEAGKEVFRLDAESGKDRMAGSLQYVLEKAYLKHQQMLRWRKEQAIKKKQSQNEVRM